MTVTDRLNGIQAGLAVKAPCKAVSSANLTLSGEQTVNGIAVVTGDRVLVKDQTDATENGIYVVSTSAWSRSADFDGNRDIVQGTIVVVYGGAAVGALYQVTTANPITIGTSSLAFSLKSAPNITYDQTQAEIDSSVTPVNTEYPEGHIQRYDTILSGEDASAAFTAINSVRVQSGGGRVIIPDGTWLIKSVDWTASDCDFQCDGILKHADTSAGYLLKIGDSSTVVFGLRGNLVFDSATNEESLPNTISALEIEALVSANLTVDIEGFTYGIDMAAEAAVSYNNFYLGDMRKCNRSVYIRPQGASGFANRNNFFGGRFSLTSGITFNSQWSIYIEDSGSNTPNDNQFFSPSFEGKAGILYDEGNMNHVHDARVEVTSTGTAGTDFADPYINRQGTVYSRFTCSNASQIRTSFTKDLGASTRTDDYRFDIDATGDFTEYCYRGARIYITISGSTKEATVLSSTHSGGTTTVTIMQPFATDNPTATLVPLVKVISSGEPEFFWPNDDIAGVADASTRTVQRLMEHRIRSQLFLESFSDDYPALLLHPGSSDGNDVMRVVDLNRTVTYFLDGNGHQYVSRFSIGDIATPIATQTHITDASTSHAITGSGADAAINSALDVLGTKINSILSRLEAFGFNATS